MFLEPWCVANKEVESGHANRKKPWFKSFAPQKSKSTSTREDGTLKILIGAY